MASKKSGTQPGPAGPSLVMIVEDDPVGRMAIAATLRRLGVECVVASDGEEAVELAGGRAIDLVLLDIRLPGIDGFETARRLRIVARSSPRIVGISATWSGADVEAADAAGITERLAKPVSADALAALVGGVKPSPTHEMPAPDCVCFHEASFRTFRRDVCANARSSFDDVLDLILARLARQLDDARTADPESVRSIAHTARASASWIGAQRLAMLLAELEDISTPPGHHEALILEARAELAEAEGEIRRFIER